MTAVAEPSRVLIVDADPTFCAALARDFEAREFTVATAGSAETANAQFAAARPHLVVLDLSLGAAVHALLRDWKRDAPEVVIVLVSGNPSFAPVVGALNEGARRFFGKPVTAEVLASELTHQTHTLGMAGLDPDGVDRFFAISPGLLALQGFDGFFKMVNPAWERTLGYTADELCAIPFAELLHPDDRVTATDEAIETTNRQTVFRFRNRYRCKDGSYRWLAWSATPSPEHRLIYASARDVTATVRMEQGLRASNDLLKRAVSMRDKDLRETMLKHETLVELDRFKDEVTATLVHDLKNPLSVIVANYDYILETFDGSQDALEALQDSQQAGHRILRMLANLVDVAQLNIGTLEITPKRASVSALLHSIVEQRRVLARTVGITIIERDNPMIYWLFDADLMTRTIENIFDNALRYTPTGGTIEIALQETGTQLGIRIGNSGRAIPPELRELVFERYGQATTALGSMNLGLGLYFCRSAIEAHGGRIWIDETDVLPTVFVIELPRIPPSTVARVSDGTNRSEVADVGLEPRG